MKPGFGGLIQGQIYNPDLETGWVELPWDKKKVIRGGKTIVKSMVNQNDPLRGYQRLIQMFKKDDTRLPETKIGFGNHGTYHYPLIEVPPHQLFFF